MNIDASSLPSFMYFVLFLSFIMMIWDTIEVGKNDATNIINAVFGSRILKRKYAILLAGMGVILGAYLSSDVMETARKGIFYPSNFTIQQALSIYLSVYIVDTILLYSYSAFGMPVSTTMTLVFELLGASLFLGMATDNSGVVNWAKASQVIMAIICSIILAGIMSFFIQRACRGAIREKCTDLNTLLLHGGWIGGGLLSGLTYFMMVKGMKNLSFIQYINSLADKYEFSIIVVLLLMWAVYASIIHLSLVMFKEKAAKYLFPILTLIGMFCMAFAFGQNDLANCASPGLAAIKLIEGYQQGLTVAAITKVPISSVWLLACGILLVIGMSTKNAQRVTKAEVRMGSRTESHVKLWAPQWCIILADYIHSLYRNVYPLSSTHKPEKGHTKHYDPLRASIIVCVSACVIAAASALGLPVSTTYVAFVAVVATGLADRVYVRGEASLKLGRSIWVMFSWFMAAIIASVAAGIVAISVYYLEITGIIIFLCVSMLIRQLVKKWGDDQERRLRKERK